MEQQNEQQFFDENGEYMSLGHLMEHEDRPMHGTGVNPYDYRPDQEEEYDRAVANEQTKRAVQAGVESALKPKPQEVAPYADDEFKQARNEAQEWRKECEAQAKTARQDGDFAKAHDWDQRADFKEKELEKLGPSVAYKQLEDMEADIHDVSIDMLFDPKSLNDPVFQTDRMRHDATIALIKSNAITKKNVVRLPAEDSPFGNISATEPANMMSISLPKSAMSEFKRELAAFGSSDPDQTLRQSWGILRKMGFASHAKRAFPKKDAK